MIENGYDNVNGLWEVTTEGDCEGRSTRHLGTWEGWVDEIALHLADKAYYGLQFKKLEPRNSRLVPTKESVHVQFAIDSNTWDMYGEGGVKAMREVFEHRPVTIKKSNYYASFVIEMLGKVDQDEVDREKALEKLSERERDLLGLR